MNYKQKSPDFFKREFIKEIRRLKYSSVITNLLICQIVIWGWTEMDEL